jgi:hypothetical protein
VIIPANQKLLQYIPKAVLQHPFELLFAGMCVVSGAQHFLSDSPVNPLEALLPTSVTVVWNVFLIVGGTLVLFGAGKSYYYLERAGLSLLGPAAVVYAIVLGSYIGRTAYISIGILVAFGLACLVRIYTLKIATQSIRQVFKDHPNG